MVKKAQLSLDEMPTGQKSCSAAKGKGFQEKDLLKLPLQISHLCHFY
jgi:hypothetical protein